MNLFSLGTFSLAVIFTISCSPFKKVTQKESYPIQNNTVNLSVFPKPSAGQKQLVVNLPNRLNEENYRVQIIAGKTISVDKCNRHFMAGTINQQQIQGYGYDYFEVNSSGETGSTKKACEDLSRVSIFVSIINESLIRYNSAAPMVVYAPEDFEIKYRVWTAGSTFPVEGRKNVDSYSLNNSLIRDCPENKITDKMPTVGKPKTNRSYYIYKGRRAEISDFDSTWLRKNCDISEEVVY